MARLFFVGLLSLFTLLLTAQTDSELVTMLEKLRPVYIEVQKEYEENLLNTVQISLDKQNNRINFNTPHQIKAVNITIKDRGNRVIIQQNNMDINRNYSITFPTQAGINQYTVILQKENHLLVERLEKNWM